MYIRDAPNGSVTNSRERSICGSQRRTAFNVYPGIHDLMMAPTPVGDVIAQTRPFARQLVEAKTMARHGDPENILMSADTDFGMEK